jgi:hypothetical protein
MVSMRSALRAMLDLQIIWESSDVDEAVLEAWDFSGLLELSVSNRAVLRYMSILLSSVW